jgi:hypothetical protein
MIAFNNVTLVGAPYKAKDIKIKSTGGGGGGEAGDLFRIGTRNLNMEDGCFNDPADPWTQEEINTFTSQIMQEAYDKYSPEFKVIPVTGGYGIQIIKKSESGPPVEETLDAGPCTAEEVAESVGHWYQNNWTDYIQTQFGMDDLTILLTDPKYDGFIAQVAGGTYNGQVFSGMWNNTYRCYKPGEVNLFIKDFLPESGGSATSTDFNLNEFFNKADRMKAVLWKEI